MGGELEAQGLVEGQRVSLSKGDEPPRDGAAWRRRAVQAAGVVAVGAVAVGRFGLHHFGFVVDAVRFVVQALNWAGLLD
ncbi:hypothetical protein [Streptomyces sp. NPDC093970]|uniref:hypothetical protein n=1 Tax=Streptomyces sp. NPDC093970 TaxID=3155076 RepID=UPI0034135925